MNLKFWRRRKAPVQTTKTIEEALGEQLKQLREQYLVVRDDDGTWTAYHKDPSQGSWFIWRRLRHVPELRGEKSIQPVRNIDDQPPLDLDWQVPDTFPEDWKLQDGNEYGQ